MRAMMTQWRVEDKRGVTPVIIVPTLCKSSSLWWSPRRVFPAAYEVFDGDTADVTTLEEIVDKSTSTE